jgi:hypothetical protein
MHSSFLNRLEHLEALISPKPPGRVFVLTIEDGGPTRDEQVDAFKAKMGATTSDHLIVVTFA